MLALAACRAPGAPADDARQVPAAGAASTGAGDGFHGGVSQSLHRAAAWIDSFLSDERSLAELNKTWFSVRAESFSDQIAEDDLQLRLRGRIVLPQFQERLHVAFGEEPEEGEIAAPAAPVAPDVASEDVRETALGLQYMVRTTKRNHVRAEVGARFDDLEPDPYVGVRWRHTLPLGAWQARATERLREYADAGLESRTALDLESLVDQVRFFRATSYARWREDEPGFEYGERFRLFQRVDELRIVTFEWDNDFVTEPAAVLDAITARVRVAHRWDHARYLFEIAPQVAWRNEDDFDPSAGLTLTFEISFGREEGG